MTKYKAKRTKMLIPGHGEMTFASKREAERAVELALMEKAGKIRDLEFQVRYRILVNGVKICDYVADFRYWEGRIVEIEGTEGLQGLSQVVEDSKGYRTKEYKLKRKLMKAVHGIEVLET